MTVQVVEIIAHTSFLFAETVAPLSAAAASTARRQTCPSNSFGSAMCECRGTQIKLTFSARSERDEVWIVEGREGGSECKYAG